MASSFEADRLTSELEAALLRELSASYQDLNASYFKGALKPAEIGRISEITGCRASQRVGRVNQIMRSA